MDELTKTILSEAEARQVNRRSYDEGYRNGKLDRSMGLSLDTARFASNAAYARGYRDGQLMSD